jgi:hypothetical protein
MGMELVRSVIEHHGKRLGGHVDATRTLVETRSNGRCFGAPHGAALTYVLPLPRRLPASGQGNRGHGRISETTAKRPAAADVVNNHGVECAAQTRTREHWYNPCAFANPIPGNAIALVGTPDGAGGYQFYGPVTDEASAPQLLGGRSNTIYGPGYYTINMSLFKNFTTFRDQYLQFRVDAFNLLNHPTLNNPNNNGNSSNSSSGGQIYGPNFFQSNTPDARFMQVSLKYAF